MLNSLILAGNVFLLNDENDIYVALVKRDISQQEMLTDAHCVLPDEGKTKEKRNPQFCNHS